jgi:hypothetical protein
LAKRVFRVSFYTLRRSLEVLLENLQFIQIKQGELVAVELNVSEFLIKMKSTLKAPASLSTLQTNSWQTMTLLIVCSPYLVVL